MKKLLYNKKSTVVKNMTIREFIDYRNYLIRQGTARTKHFGDHFQNYYWFTLDEMEAQYPEFSKSIGIIKLK